MLVSKIYGLVTPVMLINRRIEVEFVVEADVARLEKVARINSDDNPSYRRNVTDT